MAFHVYHNGDTTHALLHSGDAIRPVVDLETHNEIRRYFARGLSDDSRVLVEARHASATCEPRDDDTTSAKGIWVNHGDTSTAIARSDSTPSLGACGVVAPYFNSAGDVAFLAWDERNPSVYISDGSGSTTRVASLEDVNKNDPTAIFLNVERDLLLDSSGNLAFRAIVSDGGGGDLGLWTYNKQDGLVQIAVEGEAIPGSADGETLTWVNSMTTNRSGQLIVDFSYRDVDNEHRRGMFLHKPSEGFERIVAEADTLQLAPGDDRTIDQLGLLSSSNNEDGHQSQFNDNGELVFAAQFADRTAGVFVVTVPEPPATTMSPFVAMFLFLAFRNPGQASNSSLLRIKGTSR